MNNLDFNKHVLQELGVIEPRPEQTLPSSGSRSIHDTIKKVELEGKDVLAIYNLSRLEFLKTDEHYQNHLKFIANKFIPCKVKNSEDKWLKVTPAFLADWGFPKKGKRNLTRDELSKYNLRKGTRKKFHQDRIKSSEYIEMIEYLYTGLFEYELRPTPFRTYGPEGINQSAKQLYIRPKETRRQIKLENDERERIRRRIEQEERAQQRGIMGPVV